MNKLFSKSILQAKMEIKNRYLAGDSVPQIAAYYSVTPRDIYYHLGKLTSEDKGFHAKNASLKMHKRKEDHAKTKISKSSKQAGGASLADFNQ